MRTFFPKHSERSAVSVVTPCQRPDSSNGLSRFMAGVGPCRFWGFSAAADLFAEKPANVSASDDDGDGGAQPLRALCIAPGDVRHVLQTLAMEARRAKESGKPARAAEFSVYEREPETLARHMLLLAIALDFELPRRERAEVLLEVWANTLVREKTAAYIASRAAVLERVLTDEEGPLAAVFDVNALKSKERDALLEVLRSWAESVEFDVVRLRDERLRTFYGARYDARRNVLDWDYTMELVPMASIVHKIHFREWRLTGVCFEVRDSDYKAPNRTMASFALGRQKGLTVEKRGFWGDVANGPWAAVGVTCEDERLTKKRSDQHFKSSCDIAYHNVLNWLSALESGTPFALKQEDIEAFEYGGSVADGGLAKGFLGGGAKGTLPAVVEEVAPEPTEEARKEAAAEELRAKEVRAKVAAARMSKLPPFKLRLLSGQFVDTMRKPRHKNMFEVVTLSTHLAYVLGSDRLNMILRPKATVLVETVKFLCEVRSELRRNYAAKQRQFADRLGWTLRDAQASDGVEHAALAFSFDADTAPANAERAIAEQKAAAEAGGTKKVDEGEAGLPQLMPPAEEAEASADEKGAASGAVVAMATGASSGPVDVAVDAGAAGIAPTPPPPVAAIAIKPGEPAQISGVTDGKLCAITGAPAKYRDPISGLPYADLAAFKELRKLYPDVKKEERERQAKIDAEQAAQAQAAATAKDAEASDAAGAAKELETEPEIEVIRPLERREITFGSDFMRKVNKAF